MCCHVFEHLSDISGYFKELVSLLAEDTLLYIEVPYEEYIEDAPFCVIHEHINFFREETFIKLAKLNNLRVLKTELKGVIRCLFKR